LVEALAGRDQDDRPDTLFCEWGRSLEVVYEDLDDPDGELAAVLRGAYGVAGRRPLGELLFCVHTFFALVARLVAIEVLALSIHDRDSQPSLWSSLPDEDLPKRLQAIDAGEVPPTLRVKTCSRVISSRGTSIRSPAIPISWTPFAPSSTASDSSPSHVSRSAPTRRQMCCATSIRNCFRASFVKP
jgi:hypothetical protein